MDRPQGAGHGRFLQTDPVKGGSANDYDYVNADPINNLDLDGRFCGPRCQYKKYHAALFGGAKLGLGIAGAFGCAVCAGAAVAWSAWDTYRAGRNGDWGAAALEAVSFIPTGGQVGAKAYGAFARRGLHAAYKSRARRAVRNQYRRHLIRAQRYHEVGKWVDFGAITYDSIRYGRTDW